MRRRASTPARIALIITRARDDRCWRRDEPGDLGVPEIPTMLSQALDLLRLRGVTLETLAAEARLPLAIVAEIVGDQTRPRLQLADSENAAAAG